MKRRAFKHGSESWATNWKFWAGAAAAVSTFAIIATGSSSRAAIRPSSSRVLDASRKHADFIPGEIVVRLKEEKGLRADHLVAHQALAASLAAQHGLQTSLVRAFRTDSSYSKIVLVDKTKTDEAIKALQADPRVKYAEKNVIYHALDLPNDTDFGKLWGMNNTGQADKDGQVGTPGADIDVARVWSTGKTGSKSIVVAVIDTGVNLTHPDLKDQIYTNTAETDGDGVDNDGNGFIDDVHGWNFADKNNNANDNNGHGSHCSGTIGGTGNNGVGVAGVNWHVSILPVKFLDANGSGSLEAGVEAINYATKMNVNIMSNSWGCGSADCNMQAMADAITAAKAKGILFVAAAGNSSADNDSGPNYPSNYPIDNVLAVAATDNQDNLAWFSNYGKTMVHVAAPGVNIYSTVLNGGYDTYSGTSMATPHVAGIAALLMSADSTLTYSEIKRRLIATSVPVAGLRSKVAARGRVSTYNALMDIETPNTDPAESQWQDVANVTESVHPYVNNTSVGYPISVPGAKYVRVVFEKIDVEPRYDFVTVETPTGGEVSRFTGALANQTSDFVPGTDLVIRLRADTSVPGWGFKVAKVQAVY